MGARESTYFDLSVGGLNSLYNGGSPRAVFSGMNEPLGKTPDVFTDVVFPNPMRGVLHCKGQPESVKYSRPETSLTGGMYPNQGYARHQKRGLATDFNKPMNLPVMPKPGFYNPDAPNVLGGLPG